MVQAGSAVALKGVTAGRAGMDGATLDPDQAGIGGVCEDRSHGELRDQLDAGRGRDLAVRAETDIIPFQGVIAGVGSPQGAGAAGGDAAGG